MYIYEHKCVSMGVHVVCTCNSAHVLIYLYMCAHEYVWV